MSNLTDMMEQVKSLKTGVGIQSLLDEAYRIMGNPIAMFNTEYNLLSYTEVVTDDPLWNEIIKYGTFSKETQELFKNEGFIEAMANTKRISFMMSDKLKYDRITGKVFNQNNTHVANLVIVGCNRPFTPADSVVFEAVCKLISKEIGNSEFYQTYGKIYQENLIKNLIDGTFSDRELYASHVAIIYDHLKSNLYLAVADISQCESGLTKPVYFRDLFEQVQPGHTYAIYESYILILISTDDKTLDINKELGGLNKLFEQNNMYVGISSRFENLFELNNYYAEALKALNCVSEIKSNQRVFPQELRSINKMQQIKALEGEKGVQYLLNEAYKIFGNPVLLHDMELKLLAYTENVKVDDRIWEEFMTYGMLNDETIAFFQNEGFIDAVANTQAGTFLISENLRHNRIAGKIYNRDNIMIGCLVIVASNEPFGADEIALFEAFCEKLSKEASESEFYNNYGQAYSETLVSKLIDGEINDYALFSQDIINIFDNLKKNLRLAVVDTSECNPEYAILEYFRGLFKKLKTVNRCAIYSNYIIIIISSDDESLNEKNLKEINETFEQNNIYAGISRCFGNVYELHKFYAEAVRVLQNGKNQKQQGNRRIFQYDEATDF